MDNLSTESIDTLEVLLIDGSGLIINLSPKAAKYLGRPPHELQGRSLSEVFRNGIQPVFHGLMN
jgi:PAS domain-containing protein